MAYVELGSWHASVSPHEVFPMATALAEQALALDATVAEAHIALARIRQLLDWDWAGAERAFRQGIALNPGATHARVLYANFLVAMGRLDDSLKIGRQTLKLDPLSPQAYNELAFPYFFMPDRHSEGLELIREGLEIDPDFPQSHWILSEFYLKAGEFDKALSHLDRFEQTPSPSALGFVGRTYGLTGRKTEARAILSQLMARRDHEYIPASALANIYVALGDDEEALRWLEVAYDERDIWMVWLNQDWIFGRLRSDPRFQAILDRLDFPVP
jgi:tetratricopeptide (TPR) repeat protein